MSGLLLCFNVMGLSFVISLAIFLLAAWGIDARDVLLAVITAPAQPTLSKQA